MSASKRMKTSDEDRVKGIRITKPVVYGSTARRLEEKTSEGFTHEWKVYLKSYDNEDLSVFVQEVHFRLHKTFRNPLRVVTEPPYEVNELGRGEFPIYITIFFREPRENSVTIEHYLKLEPGEGEKVSPGENVVSQFYDEVVFQDPISSMYSLLTKPKMLTKENVHASYDAKKAQEELNVIMKANAIGRKSAIEAIMKVIELRAKIAEHLRAMEKTRAKFAKAAACFVKLCR